MPIRYAISKLNKFAPLLLLFLGSLRMVAQDKTTPIKINEVAFYLPGTWDLINKNEESGQHGFVEQETQINIAISVRNPKKMEFYQEHLQGFELINEFYKWDVEYWSTESNIKIEKLKEDKLNNVIVWILTKDRWENIILYGLKSGKIVGVHINNSNAENKMTKTEATEFLTKIFMD